MLKIGQIEISDFPLLLAPLEDVTDFAYRSVCKRFGADLMYTEFVSADALIRQIDRTTERMMIDDEQRPIGIQIFGNNADAMKRAAEIAEQSSPDLIDINFGCPIRKIASKGCGAGLLNNIEKMTEITKAVVGSVKLPVTVKTRLGWDDKHKNIVEIAERLQDVGIQALSIHGRTRSQMYKGDADWTLIGEVKNNPKIFIPVIGNGDITSPQKALEMQKRYNVDAVMIGRAAIGNPWIFKQIKHYYRHSELLPTPSVKERVEVCRNHLAETVKLKGEYVGTLVMRKHYGSYFSGIPDFREYRRKLVTLESFVELNDVLDEIYLKLG